MKLWVDVEDIFNYALHVKRPSGIQRVAFELQRALFEIAPGSVQFIRHGNQNGSFVSVPFGSLETLFCDLSANHPARPEAAAVEAEAEGSTKHEAGTPQTPGEPPRSLYRRLRRRGLNALPGALREPAAKFWNKTAEAVEAAVALLKIIFSRKTWVKPRLAWSCTPEASKKRPLELENTLTVEQGDWLVVLGSPWSSRDYAARVSAACAQHGLRFALLVYDIIPIRRPEWVDYRLRFAFQDWFRSIVPLADAVLAISHATAADVEQYCRETSLPLRTRVQPITLGTGFGQPAMPVRTRRLPPRRSFALIVSTIEARKNHLLLFRIWRELTEVMPLENIPKLVFAGRVGWLVQDLMQQLKNTDWLNGKIVLIDSPSDGELATLYEDCLFTLYPSFYEGWGLPVSESLSYGAPCVSSNRTSLPEAGGDLARYFDPDNLANAVRVVREVIEDPEALEAWRARVKREFKPVTWTHAAQAIIDQLQKTGNTKVLPWRAATIAAAD